MGIVVRGRMKTIKTEAEKKVRVEIDGKEVIGEIEREHKEWVPYKTLELYEGYLPKTKEYKDKEGNITDIEYTGRTLLTQLDKEAIARIITKTGKIPDMNKPRGYWRLKWFRARSDGNGFDNMLENKPKKVAKTLLPPFSVGDTFIIKGVRGVVTKRTRSRIEFQPKNSYKKFYLLRTLRQLVSKMEAYKIVK